jgi:hypothetical protein
MRGIIPYSTKGKTVHFDGIEVSTDTHPRPWPASKQATVDDEIILPKLQASSSKGKGLAVTKIALSNVPTISNPMETTAKAPKSAAPISSQTASLSNDNSMSPLPSHSQSAPPLSAPMVQSTTYCYTFTLEDKEANKYVVECLLDSNLNIHVQELLAVSPDVQQHFCKLTTKKCITVGTVSVHKLSGQPATDQWLKQYKGVHL